MLMRWAELTLGENTMNLISQWRGGGWNSIPGILREENSGGGDGA